MGFAKYLEDNIEISNSRRYDKGQNVLRLQDFKNSHKKKGITPSLGDEYVLILNEIEKLENWIKIIKSLEDIITTELLLKLLSKQKNHINKVKNEYINYKFDSKFRAIKNKTHNLSEASLNKHNQLIIKNYTSTFIDELSKMKNITNDDSINLNFMYWDIENFSKEFLDITLTGINIPLVKYLREEILKDSDISWRECSKCKCKTYKDFNTCIYCKYPKEMR